MVARWRPRSVSRCPDFDGDSGEDRSNNGHVEGKKLSLIVIEESYGCRLVANMVCAIGRR